MIIVNKPKTYMNEHGYLNNEDYYKAVETSELITRGLKEICKVVKLGNWKGSKIEGTLTIHDEESGVMFEIKPLQR